MIATVARRRLSLLSLLILWLLAVGAPIVADASVLPPGFVHRWRAPSDIQFSRLDCLWMYSCPAELPYGARFESVDGKELYGISSGGSVAVMRLDGSGMPDPLGCRTECMIPTPGIHGVSGSAESPDGRLFAFVGSTDWFGGGVAVLARDPVSGTLAPVAGPAGCLTSTGVAGCGVARGISSHVSTVAFAADGRSLYVIDPILRSVATFSVAVDGALSQPPGTSACIDADGPSGPAGCALAPDAFVRPYGLAVLGRNVYIATDAPDTYGVVSIVAFESDAGDGALTPMTGPGSCLAPAALGGCELAGMPADGSLFALGAGDRLAILSPDSPEVGLLDRDPTTGRLSQHPGTAGCMTMSGGACDETAPATSGYPAPEPAGDRIVGHAVGSTSTFQSLTVTGAGLAVGPSIECAGCESQYDPTLVASRSPGRAWASGGLVPQALLANFAPACVAGTSTGHLTPIPLASVCFDPDGDSMTASVVVSPLHGTVDDTGTYVPDPTYAGDDAYTLSVSDGVAAVTASLAVHVADTAPYCHTDVRSLALVIRRSTDIAFDCADPDGDPFTRTLTTSPGVTASWTDASHLHLDLTGYTDQAVVVSVSDGALRSDVSLSIVVRPGPTIKVTSVGRGNPVGTYHGTPVYVGWAGDSVAVRWTTSNLAPAADVSTISSTPFRGGQPTLEPPWGIHETTPGTSVVIAVVSPDLDWVNGDLLCQESAYSSAPVIYMVAANIFVTPVRRRSKVALTAAFQVSDAPKRGSAYLDHLVKGHWRVVHRLSIDRYGVVHATVALDGTRYRFRYQPKDARDLVPSVYVFRSVWKTAGARRRSGGGGIVGSAQVIP
jgi:hypothetical protein